MNWFERLHYNIVRLDEKWYILFRAIMVGFAIGLVTVGVIKLGYGSLLILFGIALIFMVAA